MFEHTKHVVWAAAILWALAGAVGCGRGSGPTAVEAIEAQGFRVVAVGAQDAGATISLAQDDVLMVTLDARPATGSSWYVASMDEAVLRLGDTGLEAAPGLGGTDRQLLTFVGVAAGETGLALDYGRPWEHRPAQTFQLHVVVAAPPSHAFVSAPAARLTAAASASLALPSRYDVCALGGCTPVKDQLGCGSCWAFATTAVVESAIARTDRVTRDLSEQYLLSCNAQGSSCAGGWAAFDLFLGETPPGEPGAGAVYEADDPYRAADAPCAAPHPHHERLLQWEGVASDVASLKQGLVDHGALWVTVCADGPFSAYPGGVFEGSSCPAINHAVTLVGWDDADGGYWILKNSWGSGWGEQGYMRIRYGANLVGSWSYAVDYAGSGGRCGDGVQDDDETDVDCGGSRCAPCASGKRCLAPRDCAAGAGCDAGRCVALEPCSGLCPAPTRFGGPGFSSGNLGTGAGCWQTTAALHGGACGNVASSRSLTVNGVPMACTGANWALPAARNGGTCVQVTAGDYPWAWFVVW